MIEYTNIFNKEYLNLSNEKRKEPYCIEYNNVIKCYKVNGKLHREDGPAVIYNNRSWEWFINGKRHREDGPAIEYFDGNPIRCWYLNNITYSFEEWLEKTPILDEEKVFLRLKYS